MTGARALAIGLSLSVLLPAIAGASNRYDPRLRFRTISTPRFDIHFHQGEEQQARRLARIAEDVAADVDRSLGAPSGRVQVILVNQTDLPNGWATPLPYNIIEITAAGPGGASLIGNTDDWLRLVFTHEYTHIVHLGRSAGWIGGLRSVFGRMPLLYPNVALPLWQVEGIATHRESVLTGKGRLHAGDFRLIGERAAALSGFLPLDRANGGLIDWPSGHSAYVYGALFHEYLAERYGPESLRRLTDETARRLPFFGALAFREVFDKPLGQLWREFEAESAERYTEDGHAAAARRLTRHGFEVVGPRFAGDGGLYYSVANPHGFPALMSLDLQDAEPREVTPRYLGAGLGFAGDEIVFNQVELVQQVGLQSDLYAVSKRTGHVRRLTSESRAADPDVSPDGRTIACTVQRADGRSLATMEMPAPGRLGTPTPLDDEPFTEWTSPRWSPDGRWIAAERRRLGGPSEIVLVDAASGSVRRLSASLSERHVSPAWTPDGRRILFAADSATSAFEIRSVDLASGAVAVLAGTGATAESPAISPDGRTLVYVGYTSDGYDLFSMPLTDATWTAISSDAPPSIADGVVVAGPEDSQPYSPWPTLTPRFWTPTVESDNGELVIGAATGGYDALGRHAYGIEGGWTASRARPDWQVAYAYDRWWPTVVASFSDDTDPFRGGELRTREANLDVLLPVRRVRWSQSVLAGFHASTDTFLCNGCSLGRDARASRRALRAGWVTDAARTFGYSISEEEGWSASTVLELTREALGADGDGGAATADLRGYHRLGLRHAVLAARAAAATTWGDENVRRLFSASGHGPQGRGFNFSSDAIGLLRGVDEGSLLGEHAAIVNVDYRVPIWRVERGVGTLPFFARTLHGAIFADAGNAWTGSFRRADIAHAFGAELSLDTVIGYSLPVTFTAGAAHRTLPGGSRTVFFTRIGRAF